MCDEFLAESTTGIAPGTILPYALLAHLGRFLSLFLGLTTTLLLRREKTPYWSRPASTKNKKPCSAL